jgi:eukaryotic-like serine/threonine-protein kinase
MATHVFPTREPEPLSAGKYQRIAAMGRGGMAEVWLVVARGPGGFSKLLALKELRAELCADPEFVAMFLAEARLAARLDHPNVVQTYEVGLDGERPCILMEWLEGQPLHLLLRDRARFSLAAYVFVLAEVLTALDYAHGLRDFDDAPLGVVHRDVTPHNVFVGYDGRVKLMDFGIATVAGAEGLTLTGVVKGKVGYVAPEQIMGQPIDQRTDLFSVGVMLWEALVGQRLSAGETRQVAFTKRLQGGHEPVLKLAPEAPPELVAVVEQAMALAPEQRFASASKMRAALEPWLSRQQFDGRSMATLLTDAFAEQRHQLRQLIARQMHVLRADPAGEPALSPLGAGPPSDEGLGSQSHSSATFARAGAPTSTLVTAAPNGEPSVGTVPMTRSMPMASPPVTRRPGRRWVEVGVATLVLGLLLGVGVWSRRGSNRQPQNWQVDPGSLRPSGTAAGSASFESPAPEVELHVRAQPVGAKVYLDGQLLGLSPLVYRAVRDPQAHQLRISASGFRHEERALVLSHDHTLDVTLRPLPAPAVAPLARPSRGAAKSADVPTTELPPPERLKQPSRGARAIEESNPY